MNRITVPAFIVTCLVLSTIVGTDPVYARDEQKVERNSATQAETKCCPGNESQQTDKKIEKSQSESCPFHDGMPCPIKPPGRIRMFISDLLWQPGGRFAHLSPDLYIGARPGRRRMQVLKSIGVKTLVCFSLLFQRHTAKMAQRQGLEYHKLRTGLFSGPGSQEIEQFLSIACDPNSQPMYVTCYRGVDRTAFYIAVYRLGVQNWSLDRTIAELNNSHVRTWWPVFGGYEKTLSKHLPEIQQLAHRMKAEQAASRLIPEKRTGPGV
jgi:hypothetical protein